MRKYSAAKRKFRRELNNRNEGYPVITDDIYNVNVLLAASTVRGSNLWTNMSYNERTRFNQWVHRQRR